jgi:two-component system KDP operon response regulator KdpE
VSSGGRPRILVCDDEHQILRALRVILRDAGYEAVPASTGDEALDMAAVSRPDAGIIDLVLPDMDGIEVCRRLRAETATGGATIVMLTAAHGDDVQQRAEAAGADLFLTKPFSPLELLRLIDRLGASG